MLTLQCIPSSKLCDFLCSNHNEPLHVLLQLCSTCVLVSRLSLPAVQLLSMQDMTMRNREGAAGKQKCRMLRSSTQNVAVASVEQQQASKAGDPSSDLPQPARSKQVSIFCKVSKTKCELVQCTSIPSMSRLPFSAQS